MLYYVHTLGGDVRFSLFCLIFGGAKVQLSARTNKLGPYFSPLGLLRPNRYVLFSVPLNSLPMLLRWV